MTVFDLRTHYSKFTYYTSNIAHENIHIIKVSPSVCMFHVILLRVCYFHAASAAAYCLLMSAYLSGSRVQDAASGQCLLPEDAFP